MAIISATKIRLGLYGGPRQLYGSFDPKTGGVFKAAGTHTRLGLYGGPRQRYGDFDPKVAGVAPEPEVEEVSSGGISWKLYRDWARDYAQRRVDLDSLPEPIKRAVKLSEEGVLKPYVFNAFQPTEPPVTGEQLKREIKTLEKAKREEARERLLLLEFELIQLELYIEWRNKRRDDELALLLLI